MDISELKQQHFSKPFLPRWVGIDACFCFCAALLAAKKGEQRDDSFSVIDLSTQLDSYPLPTTEELLSGEDSFAKEVDQFLRDIIENGVVRFRARDEFCELDYDYSKFRSESDLWESDSGKCWGKGQGIDYKNRQVVLHNDPEGYLTSCILDYDYQLQTEGGAVLTREIKAAVTHIEISTEDLLASLNPFIKTYRAADNSQRIDIDLKAVTGTNRFFYSQNLRKWIVEFNGKVETYDKNGDSAPFTRIHYVLSQPVTDRGPDYRHLYSSVLQLGYSQVHDEHMESYLDEPDYLSESSDDWAHQDAKSELTGLKSHAAKLTSILSRTPDNQKAKADLELIEKQIKKITFRGKPKVKTEDSKQKNSVNTSLGRGFNELEPALQQHLKKHIQKEKGHIYYDADVSWCTSEGE